MYVNDHSCILKISVFPFVIVTPRTLRRGYHLTVFLVFASEREALGGGLSSSGIDQHNPSSAYFFSDKFYAFFTAFDEFRLPTRNASGSPFRPRVAREAEFVFGIKVRILLFIERFVVATESETVALIASFVK